MANIIGTITINQVDLIEVDGVPSAGGGTVSPIGSQAFYNDGSVGRAYLKTEAAATAWTTITNHKATHEAIGSDPLNITKVLASNAIYVDAANYPTAQSAVDYAETLAAATPTGLLTDPGVVVILGAGYYNETVTIRKNVSLMGQGPTTTLINTLVYRSTSAAANQTPYVASVTNLGIEDFKPLNETAAASGIFNANFFSGGLYVNSCAIKGGSVKNISYIQFNNCDIDGATTAFTVHNASTAEMALCLINTMVVTADNTDGGTTFTSNMYLDVCSLYNSLTEQKLAGTGNPSVSAYNSQVANITLNADVVFSASGGIILNAIGYIGTGQTVTINNLGPFTPGVPANWTTSPVNVDTALDELAARSTPTSPVSDIAYNATTWDGVTTIAPSKNAVRDKIETMDASIALKANSASPALTGTPTAPTAVAGTNTTQLATTAFVTAADNLKANLASPVLSGIPEAPTAAAATNTTQLATTAFVTTADNLKANIASPALTGTPTAPTQAANDNSTKISTTAYVDAVVSDAAYNAATWDAVIAIAPSKNAVRDQFEVNIANIALKAPLASPALTGTPTAPTAAPGTSGTQIATCGYAEAALALKANLATPTFTGFPAAPTAAPGTNSTQLATTAFAYAMVDNTAYDISWNAVTNIAPSKNAVYDKLSVMVGDDVYDATTWNGVTDIAPSENSVRDKFEQLAPGITDALVVDSIADADPTHAPSRNAVFDALALKADLASPTFTGVPTAPTAAVGTNTTQLATTAFITTAIKVITKALSADASNSSVTLAKVTNLDQATGTGTFAFQYFIRYQTAATATGIRFSVNHSGTVTSFVYNIRWVDVSAVASTAAPTQAGVISAGQVVGAMSARAKSTTGTGTTLSVDAANSDMLMVIEGMFVCTVTGDLQLYSGTEVAASAAVVKQDSILILTKAA